MKIWISLLFVCFFATHAHSQTQVGFRIGDPYGLNIRSFLSDNGVIDLTLGGNRFLRTFKIVPVTDGIAWGGPTVMLNFEYQGSPTRGSNWEMYGGAGGSYRMIGFAKSGSPSPLTGEYIEHIISIGGVVGAEFPLRRSDACIFAEIAPQIELTPGLGALYVNGGGGIRFNL